MLGFKLACAKMATDEGDDDDDDDDDDGDGDGDGDGDDDDDDEDDEDDDDDQIVVIWQKKRETILSWVVMHPFATPLSTNMMPS